MSNWCDCYGYYDAKEVFRKYADEEMKHARKLEDYIIDQNGTAKPLQLTVPQYEFMSLLDVIKVAYEHEKSITDSYKLVLNIAQEEKDQKSYSFLQWYITEQIEEENKFGDILITAQRLGILDSTTGIEMLKLEELLK